MNSFPLSEIITALITDSISYYPESNIFCFTAWMDGKQVYHMELLVKDNEEEKYKNVLEVFKKYSTNNPIRFSDLPEEEQIAFKLRFC